MKHYIVTQGEYSSYHICRVFSDKVEAEKYCALFFPSEDFGEKANIEEYEDGRCPIRLNFQVFMDQDGKVRHILNLKEYDDRENQEGFVIPEVRGNWHCVWTGDEGRVMGVTAKGETIEEATKIAAERWASVKAYFEGVA